VNRLAAIQAHKMIMRAVKNGVAPERIAEALNMNVEFIHANMNLLVGIHPDVVEWMKDKQVPSDTSSISPNSKSSQPPRNCRTASRIALSSAAPPSRGWF
jgi:hypothetical protein